MKNESLKHLKNLGPTVIKNLKMVGVTTFSDLKKQGPVVIYKKLVAHAPHKTWPVCYYLYSLEGALTGKHWNDIPENKKKSLLRAIGR